ncbi:GTP-binding protein [Sinorhizobium sp. NFACC03]|uniref:CobW family GTP-binding protein n=1 Tax=Sinorhizobium sp. NFACC03 TaxID=1566295 RepID=UPI000881DC55|nr:GTP-binding protein [Sinorhizobium sp. NFACC03]SDA87426.1 GTPase, G3E family [Sinorhizobium sp. NFACC03]
MLSHFFGPKPLAFDGPTLQQTNPDAKPVTLLTGFLGSGKTTLLNDLLADPRLADTAVVVNEFGSVSVDHHLVRRGREQYMVTSTGCICCLATSDIRASLFELLEAHRQGLAPAFSRVIIETTGLADPAPIVNSLIPGGTPASALRDHTVARSFRLAGVVTAFDSVCGRETLDTHLESWKQLAFADHIVLTKTDLPPLASQETLPLLNDLNPAAQIHDRHQPAFDVASLIGNGSYHVSGKPEDVSGWLAVERLASADGHAGDHDINRHGDRILALPLFHDEPLDPRAVEGFLNIMTSQHHGRILRLKGLFALTDDPGRPLVVHAVQNRLYSPIRLDYWPDIDVRSRVIIIGTDLPTEPIRDLFNALLPRASRKNRKGEQ